jgi:predicted nuclease of predicted toxin-antitoxin system
VKVLFDHNVPHKLRHFLTDHRISTADEMGWAELENGELIALAESSGFEAMITGDQNLSYQQNWKNRNLALIVLSTNNWNIVKHEMQAVAAALEAVIPGGIRVVTFKPLRRGSSLSS